uniref:Phospholipid/glycerol acyltransferase domain-containing protein n=2 Tax=Tetranychus urticae TaxID=32264 RepID=T1JUC3_TETUR
MMTITSILSWTSTLINFYLYSALSIIITAWLGLDFGLSRLYVNILEKLFHFIKKNESLFLKSCDNVTSNGQSDPAVDKINGYTKHEIDQCFTAEVPESWNLLTPTWKPRDSEDTVYEVTRLGKLVYFAGLVFRFGLIFPIRLVIFVYNLVHIISALFVLTFVLPPGKLRNAYYRFMWKVTFRCATQNFGGLFRYHGTDYCFKAGGVAVSNHTGPLDIVCLADHVRYSFLGRQRNGLLGYVYKAIEVCGANIWFEMKDKEIIKDRLQARASDPSSYPLVIFPEGTCTTTDRILRFRKGSFELDCSVYPIAIKYDLRFGNPFWNSKTIGFLGICVKFFTNWAIIADVHYLAPVHRKDSETAVEFSERVRGLIADKIGLKKIDLDGYKVKYSVEETTSKLKQEKELVVKDKIERKTFSQIANQSFNFGSNGDLLTRSY